MDNCNKSCSDCERELSVKLCDVPSKWRTQIVDIICNTVNNYGVCCTDVLTCINNELDTLDYSCLAASSAEWEAYTFLQKIQVMVNAICDAASPDFEATSLSLVITPDGVKGHTPSIELVPSEDADNALILGTDGLPYVPNAESPALVANDSTSINFTSSGTLGHTITGNVILDPSVDNIATIGASGLLVDVTGLITPIISRNGLNNDTPGYSELGGELIQNTFVDNSGFTLKIGSEVTNNRFSFTDTTFDTKYTEGVSGTDNVSYLGQSYDSIYSYGGTVTNLSANYANFYIKGDIDTSTNIIGSIYPTSGSTKFESAFLKTRSYRADVEANEIRLTEPLRTQSSGSLISGKRYRIIVSSGGADFTASATTLITNTVGTEFTSNGVTPTWGTGSLEIVGFIYSSTPYASYYMSGTDHVVSSVNRDSTLFSISGQRPTDIVFQTTNPTDRAGSSYYAKSHLVLNNDDVSNLTAIRYAQLGVSVPFTTDSSIPAPFADEFTSYTLWTNAPSGNTQGFMKTISPWVSFNGISGVNSDITKVGINNTAPTAPLHITGVAGSPSLRLATTFTPASSVATGNAGDITWDSTYLYVCTAANTWKRITLVAF